MDPIQSNRHVRNRFLYQEALYALEEPDCDRAKYICNLVLREDTELARIWRLSFLILLAQADEVVADYCLAWVFEILEELEAILEEPTDAEVRIMQKARQIASAIADQVREKDQEVENDGEANSSINDSDSVANLNIENGQMPSTSKCPNPSTTRISLVIQPLEEVQDLTSGLRMCN